MIKWSQLFVVLVVTGNFLSAGEIFCLDLDDVLKQARRQALEYKSLFYTEKKITEKAQIVDSAFDTRLRAQYQQAEDRTQQISAFSGDRRYQQEASMALEKLLTTGTHLKLSLQRNRSESVFDSITQQASSQSATNQVPSAQTSGSLGGSQNSLKYNPAYDVQYQLEISQDLWRNFLSKELRLKKDILLLDALRPKFEQLTQLETLQANVEQLYWGALGFAQKLTMARKLYTVAQEYEQQMRKSFERGRVDELSLAEAEALVVNQEDAVLSLETELTKILRKLAWYLDPQNGQSLKSSDLKGSLELAMSDRVPASVELAVNKAVMQRYDLKLLDTQIQQLAVKKDWANEIKKPKLQLFVAGKQNGLATQESDAWEELKKSRHPLIMGGLRFEMTLGHTESSQERLATVYEEKSLAEQKHLMIRNLRQALEEQYAALEGAKKKIKQIDRKINTFYDKWQKAQKRLMQARSERVTVLRYRMEVLSAQNEKLNALGNKLAIEASIRSLLHDYPVR